MQEFHQLHWQLNNNKKWLSLKQEYCAAKVNSGISQKNLKIAALLSLNSEDKQRPPRHAK